MFIGPVRAALESELSDSKFQSLTPLTFETVT